VSIAQSAASEARKLPIIDVTGLHGDAADRRAVARELRLACTNTGFFYITGHGVPTGQIDRVFQQSREFFALPMEQKLALSMKQSACRHGYEPLKAQTLEAGAPPDLKEGFLAGEDFAADHPVGGLILEAPYTSIADIAATAFRLFPVRYLLKDRFRSDQRIARVRAPLLIMHGGRDSTISISFGEALFALANEPKQFVRFPEGGHNDLDAFGAIETARQFIGALKG